MQQVFSLCYNFLEFMRDYELVVLLPAEGSQDSVLETVKKTVEENRGRIGKIDEWGVKTLAYPIEKKLQAAYFLLNISLTPDSVSKVDRTLRTREAVLRHLLVKKETTKKRKNEKTEKQKVSGARKKEKVGEKSKKKGVKK